MNDVSYCFSFENKIKRNITVSFQYWHVIKYHPQGDYSNSADSLLTLSSNKYLSSPVNEYNKIIINSNSIQNDGDFIFICLLFVLFLPCWECLKKARLLHDTNLIQIRRRSCVHIIFMSINMMEMEKYSPISMLNNSQISRFLIITPVESRELKNEVQHEPVDSPKKI
jgi:hypothetical protein